MVRQRRGNWGDPLRRNLKQELSCLYDQKQASTGHSGAHKMRYTAETFRAWDVPSWQADFVAHVIIGPFLASLIGSAGLYMLAVLAWPFSPIMLYQVSIVPTLAVFLLARVLQETRHLFIKKIALGVTGGFFTLLTLAYRFDFEKYFGVYGGLIQWTVALAVFLPMATEKLSREIPHPIIVGLMVLGVQFAPLIYLFLYLSVSKL